LSGRYEAIRSLGAGVYGTVLECHDRKHGCSVAIKMCKAHKDFVAAAQEEIRILKDLRGHCNTPRLLRDFVHDRHICMSFNMLGDSLKSVIERYVHSRL
jgi:serine/threonine protein kinase